ncbi:MAG: hypothetical protein CMH54_06635, partial [Myxococcales bacterium]|nr:hypothetical protein [Myxococcales bacterium]
TCWSQAETGSAQPIIHKGISGTKCAFVNNVNKASRNMHICGIGCPSTSPCLCSQPWEAQHQER